MRGQAAPTIAAIASFILVFWLIGVIGPNVHEGTADWDGPNAKIATFLQFILPAPDAPVEDRMFIQFTWALLAGALAFFLTR